MAEEISIIPCKDCGHSLEGIGCLICTAWDAPTDGNGWCHKRKPKEKKSKKEI